MAAQLIAYDDLATHARDELGISETVAIRPIQAALDSAATFSVGAAKALAYIKALYEIERAVRDAEPEERRRYRDAHARPVLDEFKVWLDTEQRRLAPKSELAKAMRYLTKRWPAFTRYLDDGRLEADNGAAERALKGPVLGRKNWMFAGSDAGGQRAAIVYSLIETCKLNDIDPFAYLQDVLARLPTHPANRIDELLPYHWETRRRETTTVDAA